MERRESHLEEHSKQWKHQKQTITKLLDRLMNRRVEHWNDKEITTTLAEPGTVRAAVGRKIWNKVPRKTCVKKLVNRCGCLKHQALLNRKPMQLTIAPSQL